MGESVKTLKKHIESSISINNSIALDSLLLLYGCQTTIERKTNQTLIYNNVGFKMIHSKLLSKLAKEYIETGKIKSSLIEGIKPKLIKYSKQIALLTLGERRYQKQKNGNINELYYHCTIAKEHFKPIEERGLFDYICTLQDIGINNIIYPKILHIQLSNGKFGGIFHLNEIISSSITNKIKYGIYYNQFTLKNLTIINNY